MSYKKVMVAVDGSATSDLALLEAAHLCLELNAHLQIVHIADEFALRDFMPTAADLLHYQETIREKGKAILDSAKNTANKIGVEADVSLIELPNGIGTISQHILATAKKDKVNLLVLGTHGRRGFRHFLLGSVAEETVRTGGLPILLICSKEQE